MDMINPRVHKFSIPFLFAVSLIFVFLINFRKVASPDAFYHLKMGKLGFESGGVVKTEQISYIKSGVRIYHFEWLGDDILYGIYWISGYSGLVIFKAILIALMFVLLFMRYQKKTEHLYTFASLILLVAYLLRFMTVEKPLIFTLFFVSFLISALSNPRDKFIYFLPLVFLLWANIHPGVIIGILYFFAFILGLILDNITKRENGWGWVLLRLSIVFIICLSATLITPFGIEMFTRLFHSRALPDFIVKDENTIFEIFKIPYTYLFYILVLLTVFYNIKNTEKRYLIPFLSVFWLPYFYANTVGIALLFSIPLLLQIINMFYHKHNFIIQKLNEKALLLAIIRALPIFFAGGTVLYNYMTDFAGIYGMGRFDKYYPASAIKFIKEHHLYGRWFNSIEFGGALALESEKDIYPFIYSGTDFLSDIFNSYYKQFVKAPMAFTNFLHETNVSGVILRAGGEVDYSKHFDVLIKNSFALVYWDEIAVVLINKRFTDERFVRNYELSLNPYKILQTLDSIVTSGQEVDEKLMEELYRSRERAMGSSKVRLAYGMALLANRRFKEAEEELKKSFSIKRNNLLTNYELALLYEKLNNPKEANYFKKRAERLKRFYEKYQ